MHLYVGNYVYSSWSLRAWLVMAHSGLDFECTRLDLLSDDFNARIGALSPTRLVPVLHADGVQISDSLAIAEWAAEQASHLWPSDSPSRALARSATAAMHGGFLIVRKSLPMNLRRKKPLPEIPDGLPVEIAKIEALWADALTRSGGPFLFGDWSIADAFFAPVVTRFRSYDVALSAASDAYCERVLADPHMIEWAQRAAEETWHIEAFDGDMPGQAGWLSKS